MANTESSITLSKNISYKFLKYFRPIWYFHLKPNEGRNNVWVEYEQLSSEEKKLIHYDENYSSSIISNWDASYQALMQGIVKQMKNNNQMDDVKLFPKDIYRFTRKYHKKIWLYITFIQRLCSLFNPIDELRGYWQTRKVKKFELFQSHYDYYDYTDFNSSLIHSEPLISIIIPTYNRYEQLNNVLIDLKEQTYTNFEVIIIDQSNPFQGSYYNELNEKHHVIRQKIPALWKARNRGIEYSQTKYLLFLDDDSRIGPNWISEHLKCMDYFHADISSGVSISIIGAKVPENYSFFRWSDQLDTGNALIKRKVFEKCGLFDRQFERQRMGDGEFGLRAYLNGFKSISNPMASRQHLKHVKGGLREMGSWDGFHSTNWFQYRPIPSVLYFWRRFWGNEATLRACIMILPFSLVPYRFKGRYFAYIVSFIIFILFLPIFVIQFFFSLVKSNHMINQGALIDKIKSI